MHPTFVPTIGHFKKLFEKSFLLRRSLNTLNNKPITILGVETSCDDTCAAVVNSHGEILGEHIETQYKIHEPNGGIVPNLALKNHVRNLPLTITKALSRANKSISEIDAIAFTRGPGLPSSLSVGLNASKSLAAVLNKPLIGVHHMEAHALTVRMKQQEQVQFPYLALLISGGHTIIVIVHRVNHYTQLGTTTDESVGEAYDKISRALKLSWNEAPPLAASVEQQLKPGSGGGPGAALEKLALTGDPEKYKFTVPLSSEAWRKKIGFSFSGLRTQVTMKIQDELSNIPETEFTQFAADISASFQATIVAHLRQKLSLAFKKCTELQIKPTALVASGGVASNISIRSMLTEVAAMNGTTLNCPPPRLCTDNGAMIAWAGCERYSLGLFDDYTVDFISKWPLEDLKVMYPGKS